MQTKKRNSMYIIMKSKKDDVQLFNLWAKPLLIYTVTLRSELRKYMKVYKVISPKYMYLLVTQPQILKAQQTFACFSCCTSCQVVQNIFHCSTMGYVAKFYSTILSLLFPPLTFMCMEQKDKVLLYQSSFLWVSCRRLSQSWPRLKEK